MLPEAGDEELLSTPERSVAPVRWDAVDAAVCAVLLLFGALQIIFVERTPDFHGDDVFYFDAARALIQHHFYGINGHPETNMPPGLSGLIALFCLTRMCSHVAILRIMAGLQTAGFLASYTFLRQVTSRFVAAVICLVLISSPIYFSASTETLAAYFPYFLATMLALYVARHIEVDAPQRAIAPWTALLALLCIVSLMMASVAIALVGGLIIRAAILRYMARERGNHAGGAFAIAALVSIVAQGIWMHRRPAPLEWPIAGYPRPYLQQLLVKSGNDPELGLATLGDFVARVVGNARDRTALLSQLTVHHWIDPRWASVLVAGTFALVVLGWLWSVRRTGGEVHDWYFAGHEFIYLLWPWALEYRFFLPVAPLACLYAWRGCRVVAAALRNRPRSLGVVWLPVSAALTVGAFMWIHQAESGPVTHQAAQAKVSLVVWVCSGLFAAWLAWRSNGWLVPVTARARRFSLAGWSGASSRVVASGLVALLVVAGLVQQIDIARANTDPQSWSKRLSPDVKAGIWLRQHTDPHAIVMARQLPTTYHYSERHEVWFPPSANADLLMDGIRRLKVDYVVVVHRQDSYYLPPDDSCFDQLLRAYPKNFRLVFENPDFRVFRTVNGEPSPIQAS